MHGSREIDGASKLDGALVSDAVAETGWSGAPPPRLLGRRWRSSLVALAVTSVLGAWMFGFRHREVPESQRRVPEVPRTALGNGEEVLVRVYIVPDPSTAHRNVRSLSGTLQPRYQSPLGFRIGGKVVARHVETGDRVVRGELLMQLDSEDAGLQVEVATSDWIAARSQLAQVEAEESRLRPLLQSGSVSKSEYDFAMAALDTARARVDAAERRKRLAENQREYCDLRADRDGLVTSVIAEIGQVVAAGQSVIQWMHGDQLEAAVSVPESMQREIRDWSPEITFWSRPDLKVQGRLRELSPIATPTTRMYDARFELIEPPSDLALGMTATVHLADSESVGIPVPMSAIAERDGQPMVWKVQGDGSLLSVPVSILRYETHQAMVRGNLYEGDEVVSAGVQRLDPQCRVRVWKETR